MSRSHIYMKLFFHWPCIGRIVYVKQFCRRIHSFEIDEPLLKVLASKQLVLEENHWKTSFEKTFYMQWTETTLKRFIMKWSNAGRQPVFLINKNFFFLRVHHKSVLEYLIIDLVESKKHVFCIFQEPNVTISHFCVVERLTSHLLDKNFLRQFVNVCGQDPCKNFNSGKCFTLWF